MKKTTTKTTKKAKAEVWFDMSDYIHSTSDIITRITFGKINAGLPITEEQAINLIDSTANSVMASLFSWNNAVMRTDKGYVKLNLNVMKNETTTEDNPTVDTESKETTEIQDTPTKVEAKKKPNIFKRIWNFITGKK